MATFTVDIENLPEAKQKQLLDLMAEAVTPKKWAGPSSDYFIYGVGDVHEKTVLSAGIGEYRKTGHCGKTREQAEFIRDQLTHYAWMLHAWLEVVGDWRPDWLDDSQDKCAFSVNPKRVTVWNELALTTPFYFPTTEACERWVEMVSDHIEAQYKETSA